LELTEGDACDIQVTRRTNRSAALRSAFRQLARVGEWRTHSIAAFRAVVTQALTVVLLQDAGRQVFRNGIGLRPRSLT